ncbi:hypothetical protein BDV26DRAFT_68065 [Aspergillus bertholletiae]|uniref:Uncharacterized protein n=1 Tax=Aspergillus bertholletiae TaxID=1226010 RepID=A0A5N7AUL8_9EURO|nr:hypothetical protein BDV26DRAFT_68065 [Aspergillus bertholletiae]
MFNPTHCNTANYCVPSILPRCFHPFSLQRGILNPSLHFTHKKKKAPRGKWGQLRSTTRPLGSSFHRLSPESQQLRETMRDSEIKMGYRESCGQPDSFTFPVKTCPRKTIILVTRRW